MSLELLKIFAGNANQKLAQSIADHLNITLGKAIVGQFSDNEIKVEILESPRGRDVFILQSTCRPTNDHLMEIMLMADALHRASATRITAVLPYFGYARQDRRVRSVRVPISAKVVADMLTSVGISRVITVDLHADQIQGFFHIPVDNVYSSPVMIDAILQKNYDPITIVSPDVGGVVRARAIAKCINHANLAIIDKRRPHANAAEVMNIIGEVKDQICIIIDDMVDTAGTLCLAAKALKQQGAKQVVAYCTHPILSGSAVTNIQHSELDEVVVTNTIELTPEAKKCDRIRQIDLSVMLSETIRRVSAEQSLSTMFIE